MAHKIDPDAGTPLTPVVLHILLALMDGPLHGYAIMGAVERSGEGVPVGPGTVYGSLQRLEEAGLVAEAEGRIDEARRRRYWTLTSAGERALRAEARRLDQVTSLLRARNLLPGGS